MDTEAASWSEWSPTNGKEKLGARAVPVSMLPAVRVQGQEESVAGRTVASRTQNPLNKQAREVYCCGTLKQVTWRGRKLHEDYTHCDKPGRVEASREGAALRRRCS